MYGMRGDRYTDPLIWSARKGVDSDHSTGVGLQRLQGSFYHWLHAWRTSTCCSWTNEECKLGQWKSARERYNSHIGGCWCPPQCRHGADRGQQQVVESDGYFPTCSRMVLWDQMQKLADLQTTGDWLVRQQWFGWYGVPHWPRRLVQWFHRLGPYWKIREHWSPLRQDWTLLILGTYHSMDIWTILGLNYPYIFHIIRFLFCRIGYMSIDFKTGIKPLSATYENGKIEQYT